MSVFRDACAECRLHGQRDRVHVGPANGHHIRSARHRHRRENGAGERPLFFAGLRDGQLYRCLMSGPAESGANARDWWRFCSFWQ